mgnify:CR=1 FL=1
MYFTKLIIFCLFLTSFSASATTEKILMLGDSLTEGYGVSEEHAYPKVLEGLIVESGKDYQVINGGVSGSTTASGTSRLRWFLKAKPKLVLIALGANDGLRGVKLSQSKKNLKNIIELATKNNIKVVLAGMRIPPNYGEDYTKQFQKLYIDLAREYKIKRIPFLLKDVAAIKELNIEDGIHPNRKGHKIMANTVYKYIKEYL